MYNTLTYIYTLHSVHTFGHKQVYNLWILIPILSTILQKASDLILLLSRTIPPSPPQLRSLPYRMASFSCSLLIEPGITGYRASRLYCFHFSIILKYVAVNIFLQRQKQMTIARRWIPLTRWKPTYVFGLRYHRRVTLFPNRL